jgi:2-alkenal reductase
LHVPRLPTPKTQCDYFKDEYEHIFGRRGSMMIARKLHLQALLMVLLLPFLLITSCASPPVAIEAAVTATPPVMQQASTAVDASSPTLLAAFQGTLEDIYARVNPCVVNIRVMQKEEVMFPIIPEIPGFPFKLPFPQEPQEFYRHGLGSGFVWDKKGHIVTNNHVVSGADRISVTFYDGITVSGKVVGTDQDSDLAIVKVDVPPEELQPVEMADSAQVKVGQLTAAIGNPFGLQGTMTVGIASAVGRSLPVGSDDTDAAGYTIPDVIQTDAPINPGNSGGVLLDMEGRVIGVTSAIISPVGASAGIGFAIPSAIVNEVVPALINAGHYEHPWLGVSLMSLNPDLAKAMDLDLNQRGAMVIDAAPGSPAEKSGLHGSDREISIDGERARIGGDVVVAINGQPTKGADDLIGYLARSTKVGDTVILTLLRQGKEQTVQVRLAPRPAPTTSR